MTDVWLFGNFQSVYSLPSEDTKDRNNAKWRSQIKVPQGSKIERDRDIVFIESPSGSLVSYPVYLTDLEYQLRDTSPKPDILRPKYRTATSIETSTTYFWSQRIGQIEEYQPYENPNPGTGGNPNPDPFPTPALNPKPLLPPGFLHFTEERLELGYDYGAVGGPVFDTEIVVTSNDTEQRNALRYLPLGRWQLGDRLIAESAIDQIQEVSYLQGFHRDRLGSFEGFRFKDWSDYQGVDELIAVGDGVQNEFQLRKAYRVGDAVFYRPITKPVAGTVEFSFDLLPTGTDIYINLIDSAGTIYLDQALPQGALLKASFEFDVAVHFESDRIGYSLQGYSPDTEEAIYRLESVFVVETRIPQAYSLGLLFNSWAAEPIVRPTEPLDLGIIYESSEQHDYATAKIELKSGWVKRESKRILRRFSFDLGDRKYDRAELNMILAYFWLARGQLVPFLFANLGQIYTARFATDQLSIKFEAASNEDALFSVSGLKLQAIANQGLLKYLTPDTYLYFVADTPLLNDQTNLGEATALQEAYAEFKEKLIEVFGEDYRPKVDLFSFSDERWLTIPIYYPQPRAVYVIISAEASPAYHSTITFTPATAQYESDRAAYIAEFENRDLCQVIVVNIASDNAAYDIFSGQLFAAQEGLLGYSPALKDYGLETVLSVKPDVMAVDWLDYFLGEKDLPAFEPPDSPPAETGFPTTGLVHYYKLETLSPFVDSVGSSPLSLQKNVTASNYETGSLLTGVYGNGLRLDSASQGFGGIPLRESDTSFSFSFWYQGDGDQGYYMLCGDQNNQGETQGTLTVAHHISNIVLVLVFADQTWNAFYSPSPDLTDGGWHYIIVTYDKISKDIKLFVDNILKRTVNTGLHLHFSTSQFNFNVHDYYYGATNVRFDEIGFWDIALTPTQVSNLWNNGAGLYLP